jgi:hypothetical protein
MVELDCMSLDDCPLILVALWNLDHGENLRSTFLWFSILRSGALTQLGDYPVIFPICMLIQVRDIVQCLFLVINPSLYQVFGQMARETFERQP